MADRPARESPLAHLDRTARGMADAGAAGVLLCERPFRGQINLRGDPDDLRFRAALETALGIAPPFEPNTSTAGHGLVVLWLGPDEWLVATPGDGGEVAGALSAGLAGRPGALIEVGEARTVIGIGGRNAREVLMKGCGLDLHPRVFGPGRCAQSTLARAQVILHQTDAAPAFDVYVHRSFAAYLWLWLEDAAEEYGFAVTEG